MVQQEEVKGPRQLEVWGQQKVPRRQEVLVQEAAAGRQGGLGLRCLPVQEEPHRREAPGQLEEGVARFQGPQLLLRFQGC